MPNDPMRCWYYSHIDETHWQCPDHNPQSDPFNPNDNTDLTDDGDNNPDDHYYHNDTTPDDNNYHNDTNPDDNYNHNDTNPDEGDYDLNRCEELYYPADWKYRCYIVYDSNVNYISQ